MFAKLKELKTTSKEHSVGVLKQDFSFLQLTSDANSGSQDTIALPHITPQSNHVNNNREKQRDHHDMMLHNQSLPQLHNSQLGKHNSR